MHPLIADEEGSGVAAGLFTSGTWSPEATTALAMAIAAVIAGVLTFLDLDETFYVPSVTRPWFFPKVGWHLYLGIWWFGFVVINGVLAAILLVVAIATPGLKELPLLAAGAVVGVGYSALIRSKLLTYNDVPIGFEALYERLKGFVYRRKQSGR
jgi:hypothetical protein